MVTWDSRFQKQAQYTHQNSMTMNCWIIRKPDNLGTFMHISISNVILVLSSVLASRNRVSQHECLQRAWLLHVNAVGSSQCAPQSEQCRTDSDHRSFVSKLIAKLKMQLKIKLVEINNSHQSSHASPDITLVTRPLTGACDVMLKMSCTDW
jgi:hypothetical protein